MSAKDSFQCLDDLNLQEEPETSREHQGPSGITRDLQEARENFWKLGEI